jgi:hypothetical protein
MGGNYNNGISKNSQSVLEIQSFQKFQKEALGRRKMGGNDLNN